MKTDDEFGELDFYRTYLHGHLIYHQFPQGRREDFIDERADAACEEFLLRRREGKSVDAAQEMAMRVLLNGLYVSRYDVIYNILEENLYDKVPEPYWPKLAPHLLSLARVKNILDRYEVNGDFLDRETHQPMLMELLGTINEILDDYGL